MYIAVVFIFIQLVLFFIFELIHLPQRYITFFSFLLLGGIVYTIHLSVDNRKLLIKEPLFLICLLIIINKLYIPSIFEDMFHTNIKYGILLIFILFTFIAICPLFIRCFHWISNRIIKDERKLNVTQNIKDNITNETHNSTINNTNETNNNTNETINGTDISNHASINSPHIEPAKHTTNNNISPKYQITNYIFSTIILIISILVTYLFITQISNINNLNIDTIMNKIDFGIPLILLCSLSTIVVFIIICAYLKLIQAMIQMVKGNDSPIIYAIGLFVISAFLTETGYFNQDKMLNILTQGDLFSIPIAALIIYPFFILSINAINQLLKDKDVYNKMLTKTCHLAKELLVIVYNIMESIIKLVGFSTSSVLDSMIQLIESDE